MLVMEFSEDVRPPIESQLQSFFKKFSIQRPLILQFKSVDGKNNSIFIKDYKDSNFIDLLKAKNDGSRNLRFLKEMLEVYGKFVSDIEAWQLSEIPEKAEWMRIVAKSVLIIRVLKLFEHDQIVPWLTANCILETNCLAAYLSFMDKPFRIELAVEQAWENKNFDFLETVISKGSPFPKSFDIKEIPMKFKEKFDNMLNQRLRLHKSIEEKNLTGVSEVLKEMAEVGPLKFAYSQSNNSAFATSLKHFDKSVYSLLLKKKLAILPEMR